MKTRTTLILVAAAVLAVLLLAAGLVRAAGTQAYLGIFAETKMMKMPMPPGMENIDPAMLQNNPALAQFLGKPTRLLTVRLWSPGLAPANASADLGIPTGLQLGPSLKLSIYRPQAGQTSSGGEGASGMPQQMKFTIKRYWGSSSTVLPGQPEVTSWDSLNPAQQADMQARMKRAPGNESYFYKPDWTTAYWPGAQSQGDVPGAAALPGTYNLTTNYTGNVSMDVPAKVDFLAPIEMSSPTGTPSLDQSLPFAWKPVAGVLGYHMLMMGMEGKDTLIIWTSADVREDKQINWDYLPMNEVLDLVASGYMMKGDRTSATVPAGIFKNCQATNLMMVGYGPGAAAAQGQPLPRLQTRTTLNMMFTNLPPGEVPPPDGDGSGY